MSEQSIVEFGQPYAWMKREGNENHSTRLNVSERQALQIACKIRAYFKEPAK